MYQSHPKKAIDRAFIAYKLSQILSESHIGKDCAILSMPSHSWKGEISAHRALLECEIRSIHYGVEKDPELFEQMRKNSSRLKFTRIATLSPSGFREHLHNTNNKYTAALCDYTGPWIKDHVFDIESLFASCSRNTVEVLCITVSLARGNSFALQKASIMESVCLPASLREIKPQYLHKIQGLSFCVLQAAMEARIACKIDSAHVYKGKSGIPFATTVFRCNRSARKKGYGVGRIYE